MGSSIEHTITVKIKDSTSISHNDTRVQHGSLCSLPSSLMNALAICGAFLPSATIPIMSHMYTDYAPLGIRCCPPNNQMKRHLHDHASDPDLLSRRHVFLTTKRPASLSVTTPLSARRDHHLVSPQTHPSCPRHLHPTSPSRLSVPTLTGCYTCPHLSGPPTHWTTHITRSLPCLFP